MILAALAWPGKGGDSMPAEQAKVPTAPRAGEGMPVAGQRVRLCGGEVLVR